jgi:hypothetical protein
MDGSTEAPRPQAAAPTKAPEKTEEKAEEKKDEPEVKVP